MKAVTFSWGWRDKNSRKQGPFVSVGFISGHYFFPPCPVMPGISGTEVASV